MSFQIIDEVLDVLSMQQYVRVFHEGRIDDDAMAEVVGDKSLHHILKTTVPKTGDLIRIMASFKVLYSRRRDENSGNMGGSSSGGRENSISSGSGTGTGSTRSFDSVTNSGKQTSSSSRPGPSHEGQHDPRTIQRVSHRRRERVPVDARMNFEADGG